MTKKIAILATFLLTLLAVQFISPSKKANANADVHSNLVLYRFDINCNFGPTVPGNPSCAAQSRVYAYVDPSDWLGSMTAVRGGANKLIVTCGGAIIYADSAILNPQHRYVSISGLNSLPQILIQRYPQPSPSPSPSPSASPIDNDTYSATLRLRYQDQVGTCNAQGTPVYY